MGIKYLNSYLTENCSATSIHKTHLNQLRGKTLAIDTSIYLYKFIEKDALYENLYLMISVLRKYDIVPIFVFDGKPPPEKKDLLIKRKREKDAAEEKWIALKQDTVDNADTLEPEDLLKAEQELDRLKKRFVRIKDTDIANAKKIMDAYGAFYVEAHGESDQLCAYLVKHRFAYACVSDDMDMFLYGCDRVLRHFSLVNHDAMEYETGSILRELNIDFDAFRDILILSGTDYNMHETVRLTDLFRLYYLYRPQNLLSSPTNALVQGFASHRENKISVSNMVHPQQMEFCEWAKQHLFVKVDSEKMAKIRNMFSIEEYIRENRELLKTLMDEIPFCVKQMNVPALQEIMREDGFLFV